MKLDKDWNNSYVTNELFDVNLVKLPYNFGNQTKITAKKIHTHRYEADLDGYKETLLSTNMNIYCPLRLLKHLCTYFIECKQI